MSNRYAADGAQSSAELDSDGRVLANKLQITDPDERDEVELILLEQLYESVVVHKLPQRVITVDLVGWYRQWLGNVYEWAGNFRSLNASKDGFMFAAAAQIPPLLADAGGV
ncbi:hypothetical protein RM530_06235 [Algiphilus sp. W345]|uniref:Transposase n=1 Tax=Banduia mediterranea TaxID=3075609 RepID=A0ABU2WH49_9GAMM|nr:hypothetical protein [Algiphilus sp. W345]MDT0496964.1 hypothetical protein [Algiphilus sp. W345]